jgi:acetate kinase
MGMAIDKKKNEKNRFVKNDDMIITKKSSKVISMVIPTNEEQQIAYDVLELLKSRK